MCTQLTLFKSERAGEGYIGRLIPKRRKCLSIDRHLRQFGMWPAVLPEIDTCLETRVARQEVCDVTFSLMSPRRVELAVVFIAAAVRVVYVVVTAAAVDVVATAVDVVAAVVVLVVAAAVVVIVTASAVDVCCCCS